jgi:hypothetical protein
MQAQYVPNNLKTKNNISDIIDISNFGEMNYEQGVYDISNEEYHSSIGISRSSLMEFFKTPYHYFSRFISKTFIGKNKEESDSIRFGNMMHSYILETEKFNDRYFIIDKVDKRTKKGQIYLAEVEKDLNDRITIFQDEFDKIKMISKSLNDNPQIHGLISDAQYEKSIYWNDPHTGLLCKTRPDIWQVNFVCDLKTAVKADPNSFHYSIKNYGYDIQCAMIHEALKNTCDIEMRNFIFIVIENQPPYATAIYPFDDFALDKSIEIFKNKLIEMKECFNKNKWPSYQTQIIS